MAPQSAEEKHTYRSLLIESKLKIGLNQFENFLFENISYLYFVDFQSDM